MMKQNQGLYFKDFDLHVTQRLSTLVKCRLHRHRPSKQRELSALHSSSKLHGLPKLLPKTYIHVRGWR